MSGRLGGHMRPLAPSSAAPGGADPSQPACLPPRPPAPVTYGPNRSMGEAAERVRRVPGVPCRRHAAAGRPRDAVCNPAQHAVACQHVPGSQAVASPRGRARQNPPMDQFGPYGTGTGAL